MLTDNPEEWPFYRILAKIGYNARYDLLKIKVTTGHDRFVFDDMHADSDQVCARGVKTFLHGFIKQIATSNVRENNLGINLCLSLINPYDFSI